MKNWHVTVGIRVGVGVMTGHSTQDLKESVAWLEAILGVPVEGSSSSTLCEQLAEAQRDVMAL